MCEEKCRLVNEYVAAATALSKAAIKPRVIHWEERTQAQTEYDAASTQCNNAKEVLLRHETDHEGCAGPLSRREAATAAHG